MKHLDNGFFDNSDDWMFKFMDKVFPVLFYVIFAITIILGILQIIGWTIVGSTIGPKIIKILDKLAQ